MSKRNKTKRDIDALNAITTHDANANANDVANAITTTHDDAMTTHDANAKTFVVSREIDALCDELRASTSRNVSKSIRRRMRALGFYGGLRGFDAIARNTQRDDAST